MSNEIFKFQIAALLEAKCVLLKNFVRINENFKRSKFDFNFASKFKA
jgi:hypothetical protein